MNFKTHLINEISLNINKFDSFISTNKFNKLFVNKYDKNDNN